MRQVFRRAVITGGAGFLGSQLCASLLAEGTEVVCVDNFVTGRADNLTDIAQHPRLCVMQCDVTEQLPVSGPVDLVAHLASPASPPAYQRLPVETMLVGSQGSLRALRLAAETGARFLLASTSEVYGDPLEHPQSERYWGNVNPVGARSVYDESKRYAEALTCAYRREYGVRTAIARIFNTYGPGMDPYDGRMIPTFVRQALRGEPLTVAGDGHQTRSLCYVADTVRGLLSLAHGDRPGPLNIGSPQEETVLTVAESVRQRAKSRSPIEFIAMPEDDPRQRCPDVTEARQQLGWQPEVTLGEGIGRTIEWFGSELGLSFGPDDRESGRTVPNRIGFEV